MQVLILCGGEGIRMGELAEIVPKPLLPINEIPILFRIIKHYRKYGFHRFILCTGSKTDYFKYRLEKASEREKKYLGNAEIEVMDTGEKTNTGGRIKKAGSRIDGDFCVTYGDGVCSVNLRELLQYHQEHQCMATMTVVRPRFNLGIACMDHNMHILNFIEKPKLKQWVNGGFLVFKKDALQYIEEDSILETEILQRFANMQQLMGYTHMGFWRCMDTPKDFHELNRIYSRPGRWNNVRVD